MITRKHLTQLPQLVALIGKVHAPVSVSPRYGTWDAKSLGVDSTHGVPGLRVAAAHGRRGPQPRHRVRPPRRPWRRRCSAPSR